jgi:hypothetical protein
MRKLSFILFILDPRKEQSMPSRSSLILAVSVFLLVLGLAVFLFMATPQAEIAEAPLRGERAQAPAAPQSAVEPKTGTPPLLLLLILVVVIIVATRSIRLAVRRKLQANPVDGNYAGRLGRMAVEIDPPAPQDDPGRLEGMDRASGGEKTIKIL